MAIGHAAGHQNVERKRLPKSQFSMKGDRHDTLPIDEKTNEASIEGPQQEAQPPNEQLNHESQQEQQARREQQLLMS